MSTPFWLSHHSPDEWNRTYRFDRVRVCARCLGTYPTMFALIAAQIAFGAPLHTRWDWAIALGLLWPALVDWVWGRARPQRGSNLVRTTSGVLLGIALGRSLYVHLRSPLPTILLAQALVCGIVATVTFAWVRARR